MVARYDGIGLGAVETPGTVRLQQVFLVANRQEDVGPLDLTKPGESGGDKGRGDPCVTHIALSCQDIAE